MADQVKIFPQQKKIKTRFLKIDGNCLEIENTCLQLSNISLFSKADIAPEPIPGRFGPLCIKYSNCLASNYNWRWISIYVVSIV